MNHVHLFLFGCLALSGRCHNLDIMPIVRDVGKKQLMRRSLEADLEAADPSSSFSPSSEWVPDLTRRFRSLEDMSRPHLGELDVIYAIRKHDKALFAQRASSMLPSTTWTQLVKGEILDIAVTRDCIFVVRGDGKIYMQLLDSLAEDTSWGSPKSGGGIRSIAIREHGMYAIKDGMLYWHDLRGLGPESEWDLVSWVRPNQDAKAVRIGGDTIFLVKDDLTVYRQQLSDMTKSSPWKLTSSNGVTSIGILGNTVFAVLATDYSVHSQMLSEMNSLSGWSVRLSSDAIMEDKSAMDGEYESGWIALTLPVDCSTAEDSIGLKDDVHDSHDTEVVVYEHEHELLSNGTASADSGTERDNSSVVNTTDVPLANATNTAVDASGNNTADNATSTAVGVSGNSTAGNATNPNITTPVIDETVANTSSPNTTWQNNASDDLPEDDMSTSANRLNRSGVTIPGVSGVLVVYVPDPESFAEDPDARTACEEAILQAGGVDAEFVTITSVFANMDAKKTEDGESLGSVHMSYRLNVWGNESDNVVGKIKGTNLTAMQRRIQGAIRNSLSTLKLDNGITLSRLDAQVVPDYMQNPANIRGNEPGSMKTKNEKAKRAISRNSTTQAPSPTPPPLAPQYEPEDLLEGHPMSEN